jgi:lambda repressor-like predicted transcriptional regulator
MRVSLFLALSYLSTAVWAGGYQGCLERVWLFQAYEIDALTQRRINRSASDAGGGMMPCTCAMVVMTATKHVQDRELTADALSTNSWLIWAGRLSQEVGPQRILPLEGSMFDKQPSTVITSSKDAVVLFPTSRPTKQ